MPIKRKLFRGNFISDSLPEWLCPTCLTGVLTTNPKNVKTIEDASSKKGRAHDEWDPSWISGVFLALLKCSNGKCGDLVTMNGTFHSDYSEEGYDSETESFNISYHEYLRPRSFIPSLRLFPINEGVPDIVVSKILQCFELYWMDTSSCANKIRATVELIMDDRGVPKTFLEANKRKALTLHRRIELFSNDYPEAGKKLMAIKWIGNHGSHANDGLVQDDILDSFDILDFVLKGLYDIDSATIEKMVKEINKRKKPRLVNRKK